MIYAEGVLKTQFHSGEYYFSMSALLKDLHVHTIVREMRQW